MDSALVLGVLLCNDLYIQNGRLYSLIVIF